MLGASVYAPSCMEADAYATAFMVMGLQNAKQVIMADSDLEGCLIYEENGVLKTWVSEGLKKRIYKKRRLLRWKSEKDYYMQNHMSG